jgi:hypothetical protein
VRGLTAHGFVQMLHDVDPSLYVLERARGANFYPLPPLLARPAAAILPRYAWSRFLLLTKVGDYHDQFPAFVRERKLETNYRTCADG